MRVETVALESTGIYWITLYEILEERLPDPRRQRRHVKTRPVAPRPTLSLPVDSKTHSFGLFNGSFRPDQQIRTLRSLMRLRDNLVIHSIRASTTCRKHFLK